MSDLNIPESWAETRLEVAGSWGSGGTPLKSKKEFYGGNINWLKTGDLNNGLIAEVPDRISKLGLDNIGGRLYPPKTVIMAMYGATIGKLGILDIEVAVNQACACCTAYEEVYYKYLFYWLMTYRKEFIALGQGGAQPNISRSLIYEQPFAIPPWKEQKRIVQKIESCFEKIDFTLANLNKVEALLGKYRESLLDKAFLGELVPQDPSDEPAIELLKSIIEERTKTKNNKKLKETEDEADEIDQPFNIPSSWLPLNFTDLVYLRARIGWKGLKAEEYTKSGPRFLSVREFNPDGSIDYESSAHITKARYDESPEIMLKENDVLLCKDGSTIGKVTIVKNLKSPTTVNSSIAVMTPFKGVSADYLFYYLKAPLFQSLVQSRIQGAAIPHIFQKDLRALFIPLPPTREQQRIAKKLDEIFVAINLMVKQIEKKRKIITKLRETILFKAFEGRLVEQVPSEGTGHELLERILKKKQSREANKTKTKSIKNIDPYRHPHSGAITPRGGKVVTLMNIIEYFKKNPEGEITPDLLTELGYHSNHDFVEKFYIEIRELINSKKLILKDIKKNGLKVGSSYRYKTK